MNENTTGLSPYARDFLESSKASRYGTYDFSNHEVSNDLKLYEFYNHSAEFGSVDEIPLKSKAIPLLTELRCLFSKRISEREFSKNDIISIEELGSLLLNSYFITRRSPNSFNIPSAGATYPIEIYFLNVRVSGLPPGIYHYNTSYSTLSKVKAFDTKNIKDVLNKGFLANLRSDIPFEFCSGIVLFAGFLNRTTSKYGDRGLRFAMFDVGAILNNFYTISTALNLKIVGNGGFMEDYLYTLLDLKSNDQIVLASAVIAK